MEHNFALGHDALDQGCVLTCQAGPRRRMLQYRGRIGTNVSAMGGGLALQRVQITHGVGRHLRGQIGRISAPTARTHHGMDLDQLTTPIQFHRARIDTGIQPPPDQLARNAVKRPSDLHVSIRSDLGMSPGRDVKWLVRQRLELGLFFDGENLGRATPGGAVFAHPGHLGAPPRGAGPAGVDVAKLFSGKETRPNIRHTTLDARLGHRNTLSLQVGPHLGRAVE
nr:hypothetical protein [Mycobacterium botniense]